LPDPASGLRVYFDTRHHSSEQILLRIFSVLMLVDGGAGTAAKEPILIRLDEESLPADLAGDFNVWIE